MVNRKLRVDDAALAFERVAQPAVHHRPRGMSDRFALGFTKLLRVCADTFFAKRYGHRAIVLETVAAVPGMVGAMLTHLKCLRRMIDDEGWIRTLMEEAENERMHLMTFVEIAKHYWQLPDDATLRDVVLVVRADEAHHRDVNHGFADTLAGRPVEAKPTAPYPPHADSLREAA